MVKFRESQTARNLLISFAGESQARNRYTYFASKAKKDGYIQIADIFVETAGQECEHALRFFKFFNGGELEITWSFPAGGRNCGYLHTGKEAPDKCPACVHPQGYFELLGENW
jgi:rubrerythrin